MKKGTTQQPPSKTATQPKVAQKKAFRAEDYVSASTPLEDVLHIKQAFDVFD